MVQIRAIELATAAHQAALRAQEDDLDRRERALKAREHEAEATDAWIALGHRKYAAVAEEVAELERRRDELERAIAAMAEEHGTNWVEDVASEA